MTGEQADRRSADGPAAADGPSDRGVSEFAGVAILITVTVLVTASVGVSALVVDSTADGDRNATFSFQYFESTPVLIVSYERGNQFYAGNVTVRGDGAEATWATLAGTEPSTRIGPSSVPTVQVSGQNAYGQRVAASENVRVVYTPSTGNETVLEQWNAE